MASDNNSGCGKTAAIMTIITGLITILIFVTGKASIPDLFETPPNEQSRSGIMPTQQIVPTIRPTDTPLPKPTYTKTPVPFPTPLPDTRPGTILEVGESWWQDGLELVLTKAATGYSRGGVTLMYGEEAPTVGIEVQFEVTNHKAQAIALRYNLGRIISATSNRGRRLEVGALDRSTVYTTGGQPWTDSFDTITVVIESGQTIELLNRNDYWGDPRVFIKADIADPALNEIIIAVSGLSTITNARWRVPIYH